MIGNSNSSFFERMGRKHFNWRLDWEIFHNLFPHLEHESNEGYAFANSAEMNDQTDSFDVQSMLDEVERQIKDLEKGYGECFRYIMHRDIHKRLRMYSELAKRNTPAAIVDSLHVVRRTM